MKIICAFLISSWLIMACSHQQPGESTVATAGSGPITNSNKAVVEKFFVALETNHFEWLHEIFADSARQLNPYVPEGFPKSFDGREAIYKQYSSLPNSFGQMKFPRTIYATEDPDFLFVTFKGQIAIKRGGTYENDYLGTFRLSRGKIIEYTEYFNPIIMARAFQINLNR